MGELTRVTLSSDRVTFCWQSCWHWLGEVSQTFAALTVRSGGEGRNRAPLGAGDSEIMPDSIGYSSSLCYYLNPRFPLGLLAIILAISTGDKFIGEWHLQLVPDFFDEGSQ